MKTGSNGQGRIGVALVLLGAVAMVTAQERGAAAGEGKDDAAKAAELLALAKQVAPSLVRVEYTFQYDKGESPKSTGWGTRCPNCASIHSFSAESYLTDERPLEIGGLVLAGNKVVAPDIMVHPRFIKGIAIRCGDQVVPARIVGYPKAHRSVILEPASPLPGGKALAFDAKAKGPYYVVSHVQGDAEWATSARPLAMVPTRSETGRAYMAAGDGVIVTAQGVPVGVNYEGELPADESWKGSPLEWEAYTADQMDALLKAIQTRVEQCVLRVTLGFRSPKKGSMGGMRYRGGEDNEESTEKHVSGLLLDEKTVLVLAELKPAVTARLEQVVVRAGDKQAVGKFSCTLSDYGCFVAKLETPLPGAATFVAGEITRQRAALLVAADIAIQGENRTCYFNRCRFSSFGLGWKRKVHPDMPGDESHLFIFDDKGHLLAYPISHREKSGGDRGYRSSGRFDLTAAADVTEVLAALAKNTDPSNVPLTEAEESRLAWLGVVLQPLDKELARANNVSDQSRDGEVGAIISYVYPDSPAEKAGVQSGWILLRLHAEGLPKPIEVKADEDVYRRGFPWDQLDRLPEEYYDRIPAPWPNAESTFTRAMTDIGFGKQFTAEFFSGGKVVNKSFVVTQSPAHYDAAPRCKADKLGLTVRDMTYEVRRYLQKKPADPGVVISKVEQGGKASVAGIKPFEVITHVNGTPVSDVKQFEQLASGAKDEIRLSVLRMTKGREVKIMLKGATSAPTTKKAATQNAAP